MFKNQHSALVHVEANESDDEEVVTIVEKDTGECVGKVATVTDKFRTVTKTLSAHSLHHFIEQGREVLGFYVDSEVYCVLEEDGTEVDDEEYFQLLREGTVLMLLEHQQNWSPNITIQGSCVFDSSTCLSSSQLATALLEHIKRANIQSAEQAENGGSGDILEDDFPVEIISQHAQSKSVQNAF